MTVSFLLSLEIKHNDICFKREKDQCQNILRQFDQFFKLNNAKFSLFFVFAKKNKIKDQLEGMVKRIIRVLYLKVIFSRPSILSFR